MQYHVNMKLPGLSSAPIKVIINVLEYTLALVLILGGISTGLQEAEAAPLNAAQTILGSQLSFIIFGVSYFTSGALLLYAKWTDHCKLHGYALMSSYLLALFGFILEVQVFHTEFVDYVDTLVLTLIAALIYLRYKYVMYTTKKR